MLHHQTALPKRDTHTQQSEIAKQTSHQCIIGIASDCFESMYQYHVSGICSVLLSTIQNLTGETSYSTTTVVQGQTVLFFLQGDMLLFLI